MKNKNLKNLVARVEQKNQKNASADVELLSEELERKILGGYKNNGCSCSKNAGCSC